MTVLNSDCTADEELVSGCVTEDRYTYSSYSENEINVDPIDTEIYPFTEVKPIYTGETIPETTEESVTGDLDDATTETSFGVPEISDPMNIDCSGETNTSMNVDPIDADINPYIGIAPVYDPPSNLSTKSTDASFTTSAPGTADGTAGHSATGEFETGVSVTETGSVEEPEINVDPIDSQNNDTEIFTSTNVETTPGTTTFEESSTTGTTNTFEKPFDERTENGTTAAITSGTLCTRNSNGSFDCPAQAVGVSAPSTASRGGSYYIRGGPSRKSRNQSTKPDKEDSKTMKLLIQEDVSSAASRVVCAAKGISTLLVGMLCFV